MIAAWRGICERTKALSERGDETGHVRDLAAATHDLLQLVATWPLPRGTRFDEEPASSLFNLCERHGKALCHERCCPEDRLRDSTRASCRIIRERGRPVGFSNVRTNE